MGLSKRWRIDIEGTVQGVGFRPFIWRLASRLGISGLVFNHSDGVTVEAEGDIELLSAFFSRIQKELPPLAHINKIASAEIALKNDFGFKIAQSTHRGFGSTAISPDIAPCQDCLRETTDPANRRFGYAFTNCTNCGPRYSIIEKLPYDRPSTTMKAFEMCPDCEHEYKSPSNRRFHAQPNACDECGPTLKFEGSNKQPGISNNRPSAVLPSIGTACDVLQVRLGRPLSGCLASERFLEIPEIKVFGDAQPIERAIEAIADDKIVAIKGIGGYHLACNAQSDTAVTRLRERKDRDEKPFAIMVGDIEIAKSICEISPDEQKLLASPQRPIVLLRKKTGAAISKFVAPKNKNLGVMLPSTPLHHLLFKDAPATSSSCRLTMLVMTSGNLSDEPIAFTDDEALHKLSNIADCFLTHNRTIHVRIDDSITRIMDEKPLVLRRARGYAPAPIRLPFEMPQIIAIGADLKNAICLAREHNAFLSQHLGDLENIEAQKSLEAVANHLCKILNVAPKAVVCDLHPDYFSTRLARTLAAPDKTIITVAHHHAHIASCMAENGLANKPVIGIALDGTGFGMDETAWGGEILVADYEGFKRAAHFRQVKMPGGDTASKEPWRMALSYLDDACIASYDRIFEGTTRENIRFVSGMLQKNINCPRTSSCGRLFDAVASIIGVKQINRFEGQAAMMLEQIANESERGRYPFELHKNPEKIEIDFSKTIEAIWHETGKGLASGISSMRFHNTIIEALASACTVIADSRFSIRDFGVCLSGGCFQNAILAHGLKKRLVDEGFKVYTHSLVPPNDGGVALGQVAVAAHRILKGR
jgi:hydrogenase maturation protein HypF